MKVAFGFRLISVATFCNCSTAVLLQLRAVILEELIVRHLEFRSRSERSLLRKKRFKIAETRGAIGSRSGAIARDAVEIVRPFDRCACRQFRPRHCRLRPAGISHVVEQRLFAFRVRRFLERLRRRPLDLVDRPNSNCVCSTFGLSGKTSRVSSGIGGGRMHFLATACRKTSGHPAAARPSGQDSVWRLRWSSSLPPGRGGFGAVSTLFTLNVGGGRFSNPSGAVG